MRAAAAPSGGPEGRQKTSRPMSGLHKISPHEAGVELACMDHRVRAAGRGVDAQIEHRTIARQAKAGGDKPRPYEDGIAALPDSWFLTPYP